MTMAYADDMTDPYLRSGLPTRKRYATIKTPKFSKVDVSNSNFFQILKVDVSNFSFFV